MSEVVLDGQNGRTLTLRPVTGPDSADVWKYQAILSIPEGQATTEVHDHGNVPAAFFRDLADAWSGFEGAREYETLEGQLRFACSHDGHGTVTCVVTLRQPWPPIWSMEAELDFGAGAHLERLASDMEALAVPN